MLSFLISNTPKTAYADELSDNINEQLENLDLTKLEEFFNNIEGINSATFNDYLSSLLNGEYKVDSNSIVEYVVNILVTNVKVFIPNLILIVIVSILFSILKNFNTQKLSIATDGTIKLISLMSVFLLVIPTMISFFEIAENIIKSIANMSEIMSPIILTLMVASGGNVSASVYKPVTTFLSNGVINIVLSVILPLVSISFIFALISNFSNNVKLEKFSEVANSIIKWIIGLTSIIFGIFVTIQGLTSATYDGISIKATKYAISNSIPLVGGMLKDSFDLVVAGSVLIKNTIGIIIVFGIFYLVISPVLKMAVYSIMLKIVAGIVDSFGCGNISNFCYTSSKSIGSLIAGTLLSGLMCFITILLMILSVNAFF